MSHGSLPRRWGEGVLWISGDGDDWMGAKIIPPKKSHAESSGLTRKHFQDYALFTELCSHIHGHYSQVLPWIFRLFWKAANNSLLKSSNAKKKKMLAKLFYPIKSQNQNFQTAHPLPPTPPPPPPQKKLFIPVTWNPKYPPSPWGMSYFQDLVLLIMEWNLVTNHWICILCSTEGNHQRSFSEEFPGIACVPIHWHPASWHDHHWLQRAASTGR